MIIYVDVVLLENIIMNYIILFATASINKVEIKLIRIYIASLIGGIYAVVSYISGLEIYKTLVLKILLSITMVYIALSPKSIKKCLKQLLIFYLTSFTFGGTAFALLYFIKPSEILMRNGIYIGTYPLKIALLGGTVGFAIIVIAFKIAKGRITSKTMYCNISIKFLKNQINSTAMIDSGNLLKDPISKTPVIIVETNLLQNIIPESILDNTKQIIEGKIENIENEYASRLRIIPFTALGTSNGLLLGLKADGIKIEYDDEIIEHQNIIIGLYDKKLSKTDRYTSLIGITLIEGGKSENEHIRLAKI